MSVCVCLEDVRRDKWLAVLLVNNGKENLDWEAQPMTW